MEYIKLQHDFYTNFSIYLCLLMLGIVGLYVLFKFIIPTFLRLKIVKFAIKNTLRVLVAATLVLALCVLKLLRI